MKPGCALAVTPFGGQWIVTGAREIARSAGMSEAMIGLTIISIGTCLPELATSAVAARQGNSDLAVGNVVGSNVLNVLWILGVTATIKPVDFNVALNVDIWVLVAVTLIFFLFTFSLPSFTERLMPDNGSFNCLKR